MIITPPDTPRRRAEGLYRKLQSLGLGVQAQRVGGEPQTYRVVIEGLKSLNPNHADRLTRLVQQNEAELARTVLANRPPGLREVREKEESGA